MKQQKMDERISWISLAEHIVRKYFLTLENYIMLQRMKKWLFNLLMKNAVDRRFYCKSQEKDYQAYYIKKLTLKNGSTLLA